MKTILSICLSFCLIAGFTMANDDQDTTATASVGGAKAGLTMKSLGASVNWKVPCTKDKAVPYGYGSFTAKMTIPTTITDLETIAGDQTGLFDIAGLDGTRVWESWITKRSSTARTYVYAGDLKGTKFLFKVTMKLKDGVLTVSITAKNRIYIAGMFGLSDTTSEGTMPLTALFSLVDTAGATVVNVSCDLNMAYKNQAGKKSTIKYKKPSACGK